MKSRVECIKYLFREDSSFSRDKLDINLVVFEKVYNDLQADYSRLSLRAKLGRKELDEFNDFQANFDNLLEDWYLDELAESCEHEETETYDNSYFTPGPTGEGVEHEYQSTFCKFCGKELENE